MWWNSITNFFSSNLLQNLILIITILVALFVGFRQIWLNDVVELYAIPSSTKNISNQDLPVIRVQNVGTRLVYMDKYVFNGRTYLTDGQILPSTYSNADAAYFINLPTNNETHVSLEVYYRDLDGRRWRSDIFADVENGAWKVKTLPRYSFPLEN